MMNTIKNAGFFFFFNRCVGQIHKPNHWVFMGWNMVSMVKCIHSFRQYEIVVRLSHRVQFDYNVIQSVLLTAKPGPGTLATHRRLNSQRKTLTMLEIHFVWRNWTNRSSFQLLTPPANSLQANGKRNAKTQKQTKTLKTPCSTS